MSPEAEKEDDGMASARTVFGVCWLGWLLLLLGLKMKKACEQILFVAVEGISILLPLLSIVVGR
jgi:hypothetical protein